MKDDENLSGASTTSSSVESYEDRRHKKKKHSKKHKKKKKEKRKDKKRKKKRKHRDEGYGSLSDDGSVDRRRDRKRRRKKKHDKRSDEGHGTSFDDENESSFSLVNPVAKALHILLQTKSEFASELPIILIRLAGGTTFDLRQVTDPTIASGLQSLFVAMESYGVKQDNVGMWMFQPPPGSGRRDELVLLRVIRSLLNDVGLTMNEIANFEQRPPPEDYDNQTVQSAEKSAKNTASSQGKNDQGEEEERIKQQTFRLLSMYQSKDPELGNQLIGLCKMIAEGENVSLDGLPDEKLKEALESLFSASGLEKSEMEDDEDSEDEDSANGGEGILMGYGLPVDAGDTIHINLAAIMAACREGPPKRRPVGPMRRPTTEDELQEANKLYAASGKEGASKDDEEDEDGPLLPGQARKMRGPTLPPEVVRAQAEYRELQLKATVAGVDMPTQGGREEWMVVPGKYDFLSNIKSGQPIKSRGFQNKKSRDDDKPSGPIHPAVQAEMDAIMQAHQDARGPSLMDQHRAKKQKEKEMSASDGNKKEWKWSRDKDLDAGRRVDKDALGMILGGASDNLKTKFQGGFNR